MILRREHLGKHPPVFRAMTGLTVAVFDQLLPELRAAFAAARRQRLDRPDRQRAYYSGKKKAHTLKSRVAVDEGGRIADVGDSRPGRWADLKVFRRSGLLGELARGKVGALGDLGYVGRAGVSPRLEAATPRRKPRGKDRPPQDRRYNRAFARRRIKVGHAIGRRRRFQALSAVNRHGRKGHAARVRAVAGLVNRMLDQKAA